MILLLLLPLVALLWRAVSAIDSSFKLDPSPIVSALGLSLGTTAVSTLIIFLLGTPLALALARYDFPLKRVLTVLVEIPIVMPPVVAGLALLAAFGRRGLIGASLASVGISVTFTWTAVVLAQVFVAVPFYIRAAQSRFKALPQDLAAAASIDGANHWQTFWHITLPLSRPALLAGLILSWARALGEFGATILFAGNLQGRTQTMPLLVYGALEQDLRAAYATAVLLLTLAALALFATRWLTKLDATQADPLADAQQDLAF
jgi:molybdate transport system permease protein